MEAGGGEELDGGDAADVAPVRTVGGRRKACVVVGERFGRRELGAVCEDDVVLCEAFFSEREGGDNKDRSRAEAEKKYGAVGRGEAGEGAVEGLLEEVKVADDGERWRARGEIRLVGVFV